LKEQRYAHLFSGVPAATEEEVPALPEQGHLQRATENERVTALEDEVRLLKTEVAGLRKTIEEFKRQFE
jgi:uncharacterized protein